jgi:ribosomal protein L28
MDSREAKTEALKREWTDQFVVINPDHPELKRFDGIVGRVITVNFNNKAVIDFQDGGWYDITASTDCLKKLDPAEVKSKYKSDINSAQPIPEKQT